MKNNEFFLYPPRRTRKMFFSHKNCVARNRNEIETQKKSDFEHPTKKKKMERKWKKMKEMERKWKKMKENERKWKKMKENERKWKKMKENERKWKKMTKNDWKERKKKMKENERKWKKMKAQGGPGFPCAKGGLQGRVLGRGGGVSASQRGTLRREGRAFRRPKGVP